MKYIYTTLGDRAIVDDDMFEFLTNQMVRWYTICSDSPTRKYAKGWFKMGGVRRMVAMHMVVASAPRGSYVDHINGNTLDNRRENLRLCTIAENGSHRVSLASSNTTGATGVYWYKRMKRWCSQITVLGKNIHLGYFINYDDAVAARKAGEAQYFGEFHTDIREDKRV